MNRKRYPLASEAMAESFFNDAKQWRKQNEAAFVMFGQHYLSIVAEYLANQQGFTLYPSCAKGN